MILLNVSKIFGFNSISNEAREILNSSSSELASSDSVSIFGFFSFASFLLFSLIDFASFSSSIKLVSRSIISLTNISLLINFCSHSKNLLAVIGLSDKELIITYLPDSILFAIAVSPSLESNSTPPISRRYILIGSSLLSGLLVCFEVSDSAFLTLKSDLFLTSVINWSKI